MYLFGYPFFTSTAFGFQETDREIMIIMGMAICVRRATQERCPRTVSIQYPSPQHMSNPLIFSTRKGLHKKPSQADLEHMRFARFEKVSVCGKHSSLRG